MTANSEFNPVNEANWLSGFSNLLWKENNRWWGTRRWWVNLIVWLVIFPGVCAFLLFILPQMAATANPESMEAYGGPVAFGIMITISYLYQMGTMVLAIGIIILGQDLLLDEKMNGVTEWLLSKPVARQSLILAKFTATLFAILVLIILLPAAASFGLFALRSAESFSAINFWAATGIQALYSVFYLSLVIFLSTVTENRAVILGASLAFLFGGDLIGGFFQPLMYVTPWPLAKFPAMLMNSNPLPQPLASAAIWATVLWCIILIAAAIWRFRRVEF